MVWFSLKFVLSTNMDTRIFANRSLRLDKIKCVGFDMDATLAIYNSPISEEVAFDLAIKRLVDIGYPAEIETAKYRKEFTVRNAWFDKRLGILLKTDEHYNILNAFRGFNKLRRKEIRKYYPNKHIALEETRIFVLNTVFNVPETLLLATVVDYFEKQCGSEYTRLASGIGYKRKDKQQIVFYSTIFEDCRSTIDWIHMQGSFKDVITSNLSKFVAKDDRAIAMLQKLAHSGKKLFLLTNSDWRYTDLLMTHIMDSKWRQLFDIVIVDGCKPKWFLKDCAFKEMDTVTGRVKLGSHSGPLEKNNVYCKGCATEFIQRMGFAGKDILYVGDHIFGDVLKSKKVGGWRTLLIVPELDTEMKVWSSLSRKFNRLLELNSSLSFSESMHGGNGRDILKQIARITDDMEAEFGAMGSMLRCGWRQTHFAAQLKKYADLYTCNVYNLIYYSGTHYFNSPVLLLPHEEKILLNSVEVEATGDVSEKRSSEKVVVEEEEKEEPHRKTQCCSCCPV
ncbi:hypothetical protein RB195_013261 [Necator americanus]|uniref:HAD superfamily hydrolase, 5'-nucleotidase n=2 Tax=Necator americanus TaxID=51031 RepID=A0ABR1DXE2_NECAM